MATSGGGSTASYPGLDSELYQIAERLRALGLDREPGETLARWLGRVRPRQTDEAGLSQRLLELHYRLRFDPSGLTSVERTDLRAGVAEWLARLRSEASARQAQPLSGVASRSGNSTSIEGERCGKRP